MSFRDGWRTGEWGTSTAPPTRNPLAYKETFELMTCPWRIAMLTGFTWFLGIALSGIKRLNRWFIKRTKRKRWNPQIREDLMRGFGLRRSPGYLFQLYKVPRDWDWLYYKTSPRFSMFEAPLRYFRRSRRILKRPMRLAMFGFRWAFWECVLASLRGLEDPLNGILAGFMMGIRRGGWLWRRKSSRRRRQRKGGWARWTPVRARWFRMPAFLMLFELGGFVPRIYGRYIAPLPIDWEDYGSPNNLEDAVGTVLRRSEKARDERTKWILPLVASIRQHVIGFPETSAVIPPEHRQVAKASTDHYRSKEAVAIEHKGFRLSALDLGPQQQKK